MSHHDIEALLGAYALDAVDDDEARLVEDHLAECPRCRTEVAEHREVAALLISGSSTPVPDGVWDRIAADLGDTPPPVPIEVAFGSRQPKRTVEGTRRRGILTGLAAAAALVVAALIGGALVDGGDGGQRVAGEDELALLLADPATQVVSLEDAEGESGARAVIGADGDSVLLASALPELGTGQTYQLWGLPEGRDSMVSLGVLGADPIRSDFHVEGGITTLAISREPGGGSTQPTTDPLVTGAVV
jgi:anti-sigma-K factor RskA